MPLTPSHAAAAPLLQRVLRPLGITLPMSALVIGTMVPDFEYLIRLSPGGGEWHTRVGLLEYCLPAGFATWLIFRTIIGPALLRLLPPGLGAAAHATVTPGPTRRVIPGALAAIAIGAASHDLWDSFTHRDGWVARQLPVAHASRADRAARVGALLLDFAVRELRAWRRRGRGDAMALGGEAAESRARRFPRASARGACARLALLLLSAALGAVLNASRAHPPGRAWALGLAAVGAMSAFAVALLVYGIIDSIRHRVERKARARGRQLAAQERSASKAA